MELRWVIQVTVSCIFYMRISGFATRCSTRVLKIQNGDFALRSGNAVARFTCNSGFTLLGHTEIICYGGTWSNDPPICIANTCPTIDETPTMRITKLFDGAILTFSCTVMHKINGADKLICDGTKWDHDPPICEVWQPPTQCDFEDPELCGWSHHDEDQQEWRWNTGGTKTTRTGPDYDHTLGEQGSGHYMYFETSSPVRSGHQAWLSSPLYPKSYSGQYCFEFWYHSLGEGSISELEVFIKPEAVNLTDLSPMFHLDRSVGEQWQKEVISVAAQSQPFQIFFVATRGSGYRSDIAIDDVILHNCAKVTSLPPSISTGLTSTTMVITPAPPPTMTFNKTITSMISPSATTIKKTTFKHTFTKRPQTITSTMIKSTTQTKTTKKTPQSTIKLSTGTTKTSSIQSKPITRASTIQSNPTTIYHATKQSQNKGKNPGKPSDTSSASTTTYILIAVGICIFVVAGVGIGFYIYRKRKNKYVWTKDSSFASDNPLYRVVADGEAAVQFTGLDENY